MPTEGSARPQRVTTTREARIALLRAVASEPVIYAVESAIAQTIASSRSLDRLEVRATVHAQSGVQRIAVVALYLLHGWDVRVSDGRHGVFRASRDGVDASDLDFEIRLIERDAEERTSA